MHKDQSRTGIVTPVRTAIAFIAAAILLCGSMSEASAKSRHHRSHHHASHHASHHRHHAHRHYTQHHHRRHHRHFARAGWRNANAFIPSSGGRSFAGMASFYGNESGSKTASGQRFNQNAMTAAHRSLPFGTRLRVTHGGRSVVVTINDRGPFIRGRVLDLSKGAARAIGLTSSGVGRVYTQAM